MAVVTSKVTERSQTTLPPAVRTVLGLQPGERIGYVIDGNEVRLVNASALEHVDPIITFHSSVTRQDADNMPAGGWYGDQRMTREEALRSMTLWPAYAAFQENELGSISVGKYADFTILNRDIMTVAPERILGAKVIATYVGGAAVYQAKVALLMAEPGDASAPASDSAHAMPA